jgi:predicted O-methyltransferase YrrM
MSVGETKGRQVEDLVRSKKPKVSRILGTAMEAGNLALTHDNSQLILELGSYVGYSGISFSRVSHSRHYSIAYCNGLSPYTASP